MVDMHKQRAFTMIELLVVLAIIAVMVGLLFPAIGAVRRSAKQTENSTKVRNIIQGMIQFSDSHRGFLPGFDGFEFTQIDVDKNGSFDDVGQNPEARFWILLDGNYTDPGQLISPAESKSPWPNLDLVGVDQQKVTTDNYSYAMMNIGSDPNTDPFTGNSADDKFRREEWRNEQNTLAPLVSDRLAITGSLTPTLGDPTTYLSIHDGSKKGKWKGTIGHGDLSVEFSSTTVIETRFAGYRNDEDDIFDSGDGTGTAEEQLKNADMTYDRLNEPRGDVE